jgi:hypothetical protein
MSNAPGDRFRIDQSQQVLDDLKGIVALARMLGRVADVTNDLRRITEYLETHPLAWGDPTHQFRQLGLVVCRGLGQRLVVEYAVDEQRRIVYLRRFHARPSCVLDVGEG